MRPHPQGLLAIGLPLVVTFFLLLPSVAREAVGLRDSDLFVSFAYSGATLKSPGFGLLHMLSRSFLSLPLPLETTFQAHLLALVLGLSSVGLLAATLWLAYPVVCSAQLTIVSRSIDRILLSWLGPLLLLTNPLFVRSSLFLERQALSFFLLFLWVFALTWWRQSNSRSSLLLLGLTLGLGISHQWWFLAIFSVSIVLLFRQSKTLVEWALFAVSVIVALFMPLFYLYQLNLQPAAYSWIFERSISGLTEWVASGYWVDGEGVSTSLETIIKSTSIEQTISAAWQALILLVKSNWVMLLGVLGLIPLFNTTLVRTHFLSTCVLLGWLSLTVPWGKAIESEAIATDYFSLLTGILIVPLSLGVYIVVLRISRSLTVLKEGRWVAVVPSGILGLGLLLIATSTSARASVSQHSVSHDLTEAVATQAKQPGIMTCFSFRACYRELHASLVGTEYAHTLIPFYVKPGVINVDTSQYQGFSYDFYPMIMFDILSWNRTTLPVYTLDMFEEYFNIMGVDFGFINYIPLGYVSQLADQLPQEYPAYDSSVSQKYQYQSIAWWDHWSRVIKLDLAKLHMFNSSIYLKSNRRELSKQESNYSTNLAQELTQDDKRAMEKLREQVESLLASDFYELGAESASSEDIIKEVEIIRESGRTGRAMVVARGAVTRDPRDIQARLLWAELLSSTDASDSAILEYQHVLRLDPDNQIAKSQIERLLEAMDSQLLP